MIFGKYDWEDDDDDDKCLVKNIQLIFSKAKKNIPLFVRSLPALLLCSFWGLYMLLINERIFTYLSLFSM